MTSSKTSSSSPPWRPPGAVPPRPSAGARDVPSMRLTKAKWCATHWAQKGLNKSTVHHLSVIELYEFYRYPFHHPSVIHQPSDHHPQWKKLISPRDRSPHRKRRPGPDPPVTMVDGWAYGVLAAFVFMVLCGLAMEDGVRLSFLNTKEVIWIYIYR